METIHFNLNSPPLLEKGGALTLGCFDGIHLGHQKIISLLKEKAKKQGLKTYFCLFDPHPLQILQSEFHFKRLFTIEEIQDLLKPYGLDYLVLIPFTKAFSHMPPEKFLQNFLKAHFEPKVMVVGYDFSFGKNKEGQFFHLKKEENKQYFQAYQVAMESFQDEPISSSRIKISCQEGQMEKVQQLLGRPFFFLASVEKGEGRGQKLGFPTANLKLSSHKLTPKKGVYVARTFVNGCWHKSVINIGNKPTFSNSEEICLEVHIIEGGAFDLYGRLLKVEIGPFLRSERLFQDKEALKRQIQEDIKKVLKNSFFNPII